MQLLQAAAAVQQLGEPARRLQQRHRLLVHRRARRPPLLPRLRHRRLARGQLLLRLLHLLCVVVFFHELLSHLGRGQLLLGQFLAKLRFLLLGLGLGKVLSAGTLQMGEGQCGGEHPPEALLQLPHLRQAPRELLQPSSTVAHGNGVAGRRLLVQAPTEALEGGQLLRQLHSLGYALCDLCVAAGPRSAPSVHSGPAAVACGGHRLLCRRACPVRLLDEGLELHERFVRRLCCLVAVLSLAIVSLVIS